MSKKQHTKLNYITEYSGSASNVIKSVVLGMVDAGAVFVTELESEPKEIQEQLRSIITTHKVAPHPLCAHPRVPRSVQNNVKKAMFTIATTPKGAELFKKIRLTSPVAADYEKDYKSLEEIDVKVLSDWGK